METARRDTIAAEDMRRSRVKPIELHRTLESMPIVSLRDFDGVRVKRLAIDVWELVDVNPPGGYRATGSVGIMAAAVAAELNKPVEVGRLF